MKLIHIVILSLFISSAFAQEDKKSTQTIESVTEQAQHLINAVRSQREAANDIAAQITVQLVALQKELDATKKMLEEKNQKELKK